MVFRRIWKLQLLKTEEKDMVYLFLIALFFILIMFLLGVLIIDFFDLKKCGIQFAAPVGMVAFLAILQIVYYPVQILEGPSSMIHCLTLLIACIIVILAMIKRKTVICFFKQLKQNKKSIFFAVLLFILFCILYTKIEFMLRTEDANFYINYVYKNVYTSNIGVNTQVIYKYQGIYNFYSTLVYLYHRLSFLPGYVDLLPLGIVSWIPSILFFWAFSFFFVDLLSMLKCFFIKKYINLLYFGVVVFTCLLHWYLTNPYYGNTFRRITIVYLIIAIYSYYKSQNWKDAFWVCVILFSFISQTSTGFFLSAMLVYALLVILALEKRKHMLVQFGIIVLPIAIYLVLYVPKMLFCMFLGYGIIFLSTLFHFDRKIENIVHFLGKLSLIVLPCLFTIIPYMDIYSANANYSSIFREHSFDGVYGYLQFNQGIFFSFFNVVCWISIILFIIVTIKKKCELHYFGATMGIVLIVFFNPLVCQFVSDNITGLVYFRIYDILFNPFTHTLYLAVFLDLVVNDKFKNFFCTGMAFLFMITGLEYAKKNLFNFFNNKANLYYHTTNEEMEVLQTLREKMYVDDPMRTITVASHIYGTELLASYPIHNVVNNRVDNIELLYSGFDDESIFQQIFYRKLYDDPRYETDYMKACQLAKDRGVEYSIVETQYNYPMEDGLGYCGEVLFEQNGYRVYIMRYDWMEK